MEQVAEYFVAVVLEFWIADPDELVVHVDHANKPPQRLTGEALIITGQLPGFECCVSAFFDGY